MTDKCREYIGRPLHEQGEWYLESYITSFWMRVGVAGPDDCWLWLGRKRKYGFIEVCGKHWRAHRFAWFLHFGPIPSGMFICHSCDTPGCCNPRHLFPGTPKLNSADYRIKKRGVRLTNRSGQTGLLDLTYETERAYGQETAG